MKRGTATSEAILKRYNSYNVTHPTYKAIAEVGKAEKTIFLCDYLASREVQREVHEGLNVQAKAGVLHLLDTGHFALEDQGSEIARLVQEFINRKVKYVVVRGGRWSC